jgi:hypothetical protein
VTFTEALDQIIDGKRATREEWSDKRHYGLLKDEFLSLHKAGEAEGLIHPWIVSEGDLLAEDWIIL